MANLRDIQWSRLIAEGIAIVASILLAFSIDAWWASRNEGLQAIALQAGLFSEFEEVRDEVSFQVTRHQLAVEAADVLLNKLSGASALIDIPAGTLGPLILTPTIDASQGAIDSIITSGQIDILPNPRLRSMLVEWPSQLEDVREEELVAKQFVHEQLTPYLAETIDLSPLFKWRMAESEGAVTADIGEVTTAVPTNPVLMNMIETRRYLAIYALSECLRLMNVIDEIQVELGN